MWGKNNEKITYRWRWLVHKSISFYLWNKNEKLLFTFYWSNWLFFCRIRARVMMPISVDKSDMTGLYTTFTLYVLLKYAWQSVWKYTDKTLKYIIVHLFPLQLIITFSFYFLPLSPFPSHSSSFAGKRRGHFWYIF